MGCPSSSSSASSASSSSWRLCCLVTVSLICLQCHVAAAADLLQQDHTFHNTTERAVEHEDEHEGLPQTASASRQGATFSYHKGLLPLDGKDVLCFSLAVVGLIIAAGGGIGGGGILVPLYMLLLGFRPKHGIALANLTILGGAVANVWFNCSRRLPSGRSMIDWDIILIMEPSTIAGAVVGSFLSKKLPDFVLTVSMAFMLLFLALRTLEKGVSLFKKESSAIAERAEQSGRDGRDTALVEAAAIEDQRPPEGEQDEEEQLLKKAGRNAGGHEAPLVPCAKVLTLVVCILGTVALTILKGGGEHGSPIGIECGSPGFWVLSLALLPWIAVFLCMFRRMLLAENAEKIQANHRFEDGEIEWNAKRTILYPAVCTIAGVMAGLFGVGGGIVKGPLMLEMGVAPKVAAATAATMILFTTTATCVSFAVFGILEPQYGCALFLIGASSLFQFRVLYNSCQCAQRTFEHSSWAAPYGEVDEPCWSSVSTSIVHRCCDAAVSSFHCHRVHRESIHRGHQRASQDKHLVFLKLIVRPDVGTRGVLCLPLCAYAVLRTPHVSFRCLLLNDALLSSQLPIRSFSE